MFVDLKQVLVAWIEASRFGMEAKFFDVEMKATCLGRNVRQLGHMPRLKDFTDVLLASVVRGKASFRLAVIKLRRASLFLRAQVLNRRARNLLPPVAYLRV